MVKTIVTDEVRALCALSSSWATEDVDYRDFIGRKCRRVFLWGRNLGRDGGHRRRSLAIDSEFENLVGPSVLLSSLSTLVVAWLGGFGVGAGFDHEHVGACSGAEDQGKGPELELLA